MSDIIPTVVNNVNIALIIPEPAIKGINGEKAPEMTFKTLSDNFTLSVVSFTSSFPDFRFVTAKIAL